MSTVVGELSVNFNLDSTGFEKGINDLSGKLDRVGKKFTDIGQKLTLGVTTPIVGAFGFAINAASDLNETINKTAVVFDDSAASVMAWSEDSATAFGLSQNEALGFASTFGNIFTSMGIASDEAANLSTSFVQLGADLGSFNNVPTAEALDAIRAGVLGEYEPLRRFGIVLTEAEVNAKALEMGLVDANGEVTEAGKVAARTALINEKAANAQGDFAETSGSLANQLKILRAKLTDAAAAIGQILLPYATRLVGFLSGMIDRFQGLSGTMQRVIIIVGLIAAAIGPLMVAFGTAAVAIGSIIKLGPQLKVFFNTIRTGTLSALGPVLIAVAIFAALYFIWTRDLFGIQTKIRKWFDAFKAPGGMLDKLKARFEAIKQVVLDFAARALAKAVEWFKQLADAARGPLNQALGILKTAFGVVMDVIGFVIARIGPLKSAFEGLFAYYKNLAAAIISLFRGDFSAAFDHLKAALEGAMQYISGIGEFLWSVFGDALRGLWNVLAGIDWAGLGSTLLQYLGDFGGMLWGWISAGAAWAAGELSGLWDDHKETIKAIPGAFITLLDDIGEKLWEWLQAGAEWAAGELGDLWEDHKETIKAIPGQFVALLGSIGSKLWEWFKVGARWVGNKAATLWDDVKPLLAQVPGKLIEGIGALSTKLWTWAKAGAQWVANKISTLWDDHKATIQALPGKLVDAMGDLGGKLWEYVKAAASWAMKQVTGVGSDALSSMTKIGEKLGGAIKGAFNNALSGVGDFLIQKLNGVIGWINSWIGRINGLSPVDIPYIPLIGTSGGNWGTGRGGGGAGGGGFTTSSLEGMGGYAAESITINVNGAGDPATVADEVYRRFSYELGLRGAL